MIIFNDISGASYSALGTIQRKHALNGEKSLSGVLYEGRDVLNNIDKGWSLEFDGELYVITFFEINDKDNTVSFDAIHHFFWKMTKSVLYASSSGSHPSNYYFNQIFSETGYSYKLNFSPNAVEKDNWGMKTKLSLFNDIISSIDAEFEIVGKTVVIAQKIGTDLSTIVRYGFNLSDMKVENDISSFVTYGEGFGTYEDKENQSGPRLHTTYTSPLASIYGILQAEPVDDQRYTISANLYGAVKEKVDSSFSVSIALSLYDLSAAGYPYKMARVGDWLMAIDERLEFKQRIRIISVDDEFDADGTRISYSVTAGNIGLVQKYQEASASLSTQVNNVSNTANDALDIANDGVSKANNAIIKVDGVINTGVFYESGNTNGGVGIGKDGLYVDNGETKRALINNEGFQFAKDDLNGVPLDKITLINSQNDKFELGFSNSGTLVVNGEAYIPPSNSQNEIIYGSKTFAGLTYLKGGFQMTSPSGIVYIISIGDDGNFIKTKKGL